MGPLNQPAFLVPNSFGTPAAPGADLDARFWTNTVAKDSGVKLKGGAYTLVVSGANCTLRFQSSADAAVTDAGANDIPLLDGQSVTFVVRNNRCDRVSVFPQSGTFKCWCWQSTSG